MLNPWFYLLCLSALIGIAAVLNRTLPLQRRLTSDDTHSHRLLSMDGLRGILATSVFVGHGCGYYFFAMTGTWQLPPSNFFAQLAFVPVTLFFFITGYLFWSKLIKKSNVAFVPFVEERLMRLTPAFLFALTCFIALVAVESHLHLNEPALIVTKEVLGWIPFGLLPKPINQLHGSETWLSVAWTLRFEWIFYFSLPFMAWFARKWGRTVALLVGCLTLHWLLLKARHLSVGHEGLVIAYLRFLGAVFAGGIVAAYIPREGRWAQAARSKYASFLSLIILFVVALWLPPSYDLIESTALFVPFACVALGNSWFGLLTTAAVRLLGRVSYSFYLLHIVCLRTGMLLLSQHVYLRSLAPFHYWLYVALCGAFAVTLSCISFQFFEYPFMRRSPHSLPKLREEQTIASSTCA